MTAMNIFVELSNKKSVFKTKEFLDHRFVPEKLPHREEKFELIAHYWVEALKKNNTTRCYNIRKNRNW